MSSPAPLPLEIYKSAQNGELQKVVKWLRKGGLTDALCSDTMNGGQPLTVALLHAAAANGHLEMVKELLTRGAGRWPWARAVCAGPAASQSQP